MREQHTPDRDRDVIVQHISGDVGCGDRWVVFVGPAKRAEMDHSQGALVFARLLADLQQRTVWVCHGSDGPFEPLDPRALKGCSCC